jgi:hypothetical protein
VTGCDLSTDLGALVQLTALPDPWGNCLGQWQCLQPSIGSDHMSRSCLLEASNCCWRHYSVTHGFSNRCACKAAQTLYVLVLLQL